MAAALPHSRQHRNGYRQLQRAGEVHHQNRQGLGDISRQQIGQHRAAQGVGHQAVRQAGGLVLGGRFQLFRLLDHLHDAVVASSAGGLFHADNALALFGHGPGVHIAARPLGNGHGLARHRRLVHHSLACDHLAVQGNHIARAHHHPVPGLNVGDGGQYLRVVHLQPHLVNVQGHGPGQVGHRLLVGPLLQNFAQPQHEHHGPGGVEVAPEHGHRHGGGVQHGNGQLPVP